MKRLVLLAVLCGSRVASATGQCDSSPVEQYDTHPDDLNAYAGGKLGVVHPSFARMYLARAYLAITGGTIDGVTQKELVDLWMRRHFAGRDTWAGQLAWESRRKSLGAGPTTNGPGTDETFCLDEAYATAARTATRLSSKGGLDKPELKAWLGAQDNVFANCTNRKAYIPEALPKTASPLATAERTYQIAAATFYAGRYGEAATLFSKIGKDTTSPWASWGDYLAARALLRDSAIPSAGEGDPSGTRWNGEGLTKARTLLETINKTRPERARAARALLDFIRVRQTPAEHIHRITAILRKGGEDYPHAVGDWTVALDTMLGQVSAADVPMLVTADQLPKLREQDELTDWVLTYGKAAREGDRETAPEVSDDVVTHALERYQAKKSTVWLLAALAAVPSTSPQRKALIAAAARLPRSSPAHDTAAFLSLGLQTSKAERTARGKRIDDELAAHAAQPSSTFYNWLLDERLAYATTFDDVLDHAVRSPVGESDDCGLPSEVVGDHRDGALRPQIAHEIEAAIERGVPWSKLEALAGNAHTPPLLRTRLARMGLVRALVLGDRNEDAQALADRFLTIVRAEPRVEGPEISSTQFGVLDALAKATTPDDKRFQSALTLVYLARSLDFGSLGGTLTCPGVKDETPPLVPTYAKGLGGLLTSADRKARDAELALMRPGGSVFDVGVTRLLAFAKDHPTDERLVQPLYDINGISRHLHGACHASKSSKAAYQAMHKLFPSHPLTKKVGYWY